MTPRETASPASPRTRRLCRVLLAAGAAAALLAACSGGGSGSEPAGGTRLTVNGDVPLAYVKRSTAVGLNPTDGANFAPGGDLMLREKSSPSAIEHNLTSRFTQGRGDASDPEVSYDGKKIIFSMRCPADSTATVDGTANSPRACTGRWNIWEYVMADLGPGLARGSFRRLTASTEHDDVDPVYLPAGRGVIFSSNRQAKSSRNQALGRAYFAADEYERERVMNLHSMAADGSGIEQITFNQSHDRNPVIRPNGDIMFSRWEHVADRNRFAIFRSKPDGTDLFVLFGAQSQGNSYLHPRDMDPAGNYKGQLVSTLMSLSGTQEGGSLQVIDAARYSEDNTPAATGIPAQGGQISGTKEPMSQGRGLSEGGRMSSPYPLWDGSNRVLVAWRPCQVTRNGVVIPCVSLTAAERAMLADTNRTMAQRAQDPVQDNAPSAYGIYMLDMSLADMSKQTMLPVATPPDGFMYLDPVALIPRTEPNVVEPTTVDPALAARDMALIEVRSIYDTDGLNRMAAQMLVAADRGALCPAGQSLIPQTRPHDPTDTRGSVADLNRMKDPADVAYHCAPARWVRATRAVAPPSGAVGVRFAIGETEFEQQQILGYAPIEPDGSFKLQVPADIPLALAIVDAEGRAFQTHTNWIQVRPGERRTCDGCHSPRRGAALNTGPIVNTLPPAMKQALASQHQSGETLASLRTRLDPAALQLATHPVFADTWAETQRAGVTPRETISMRYTGNPDPADDLQTPAPQNGVINYAEHIQPLWTRPRGPNGAHTCVACHADSAKLDLRATMAGSGRLVSYEELLLGDPLFDNQGRPIVNVRNGVPEVARGEPLVETSSGAANTAGQARKSRITEILWGQQLLASANSRREHPAPPASVTVGTGDAAVTTPIPDHGRLLNRAEKRLLAEWMDLGGQYYNDPFDTNNGIRAQAPLSRAAFVSNVQPILRNQCFACHQAGMGNPRNRFVLTGSEEGDFNVSLSLINDTCTPANNPLLARPATLPHPMGAIDQTTALLPLGSPGYTAIANWITSGCTGR